jgi:hypothetical protein
MPEVRSTKTLERFKCRITNKTFLLQHHLEQNLTRKGEIFCFLEVLVGISAVLFSSVISF